MVRSCVTCGKPLEGSPRKKFCGDRCRQRAHRGAVAPVAPVVALPSRQQSSGLYASTLRELEAAGRVDTVDGQAALVLALRIEASQVDTGSSFAALIRELRATKDAALASAPATGPVDELRRKRLELLGRGG